MSIKPLHSLSLRSGLLIFAVAVVLTVVLSGIVYKLVFDDQLTLADRQLGQLVDTVENSAAVAAYLDNQELATEVVRGLASNDIVAAASLQSQSGMRVVAGDVSVFSEARQRYFELASPFMPDESSGRLSLQPNQRLIEANARQVALVYVASLAAHSLLLTIVAIALVRWQLARPLNKLAERLHQIEPGSENRMPVLKGHSHDEVGQLVTDINGLLEATQLTLEGERRLRQYVEAVEKRLRLIFDHASSGIALISQDGQILMSNPSFNRIMSLEDQALPGASFVHLFDDASRVRELLDHAVQDRAPISEDLQLSGTRADAARWLHALFSSVSDEQGNLLIECILYDVSERTRREQQTRQEAERDPLTQLYNRRAGERELQSALEHARSHQLTCALMLVDLDRFKPINDTYGHDAGDRVLKTIADRLVRSLRKQDIVIRWGGDEFVVLVYPGQDIDAVPIVAAKILQQLAKPIELGGGRSDSVGASIGIALYPQHSQSLGDLIARADKAMYQVKENGRNHYVIYQPPLPNAVGGQ